MVEKVTWHHKLTRNRTPEIIASKGNVPVTRILHDEEFLDALHVNFQEEVTAYLKLNTAEKLAEILEVMYAIIRYHGVTQQELELLRCEKARNAGTFDQKIYLECVKESR